jgi:hypothetical protein
MRLLLVDGRAAGAWYRERLGRRLELRIHPARRLTRAHHAQLRDEVERIGAFLGLEPVLSVA